MLIKEPHLGPLPGRALMAAAVLAAAASLGACGGNSEEAVFQNLTVQQQREAAALKRAHQINAEAMSKSNIKNERAAAQTRNN